MTDNQFVRATPRGFLLLAEEFFEVYNLLHNKYPNKTDHFFTKYYSLCHSYELVLKALLLNKNIGIEKLRKKLFGHNLTNLLNAFKEKYPTETVSNIVVAITNLANERYNSKEFEYHSVGIMHVPDINQLDGVVNGFLIVAKKTYT